MFCNPVHAQQRDLAWPKTFSGQPDFVFEREDIIKTEIQRAQSEGAEPPITGTLDKLLVPLSSPLAPLQLNRADRRAVNLEDGATVAPFIPLGTAVNQAALPDVIANELLDVSEFKALLETAAATAVRKARVNQDAFDFSPYLARLTLQAVVTSPKKYAVINERRYQPGDRFHIIVPVTIDIGEIEAALEARMPPEDVLPADRYAQYQTAKAEVLANYKTQIEAGSLQRTQKLAVRVERIESRRAVLKVGGRQYDLAIKYAL